MVPAMATVAPARSRSALTLALLLGGLSAVGPLSLDMYLPGLPELGRDLGASGPRRSCR